MDPCADAHESRDPMLRCAGSERKAATFSRAETPQVAWTEWSTIDPARSMSQRNGVSMLGLFEVGSGMSGVEGVGSGGAGGPVTSAGKVVAGFGDRVAGASNANSGKTGGGTSLRRDTGRYWGRGTRPGIKYLSRTSRKTIYHTSVLSFFQRC